MWSCDNHVVLCDDHVMLMWWSYDAHVMVMWWSYDDHVIVLCGSTTYLPGVTSTLIKEGFCLWKCSGCKVDESCSLLHFTHVLWNQNGKVTLFSGSWKIPASFSHNKTMWVILSALFSVLHHSYCRLQCESSMLFVLHRTGNEVSVIMWVILISLVLSPPSQLLSLAVWIFHIIRTA